jgi:hypothetical protein
MGVYCDTVTSYHLVVWEHKLSALREIYLIVNSDSLNGAYNQD